MDKSRDTKQHGHFCYSLDEFFFLTNPEDMVKNSYYVVQDIQIYFNLFIGRARQYCKMAMSF